jgi:hypothetical protein
MTISESDILQALQDALKRSPGGEGVTANEMAEAKGLRIEKVYRGLKKMIAAGQVVPVKVTRQRIDGMITLVPGYQVVTPKKGRK